MDNAAGIQGLIGDCDNCDTFIDVGGAGLFTNLTYRDSDNGRTNAADHPTGLGYLMLGKRLNEDIVVGFGAFTPAGFASDYELNGPAFLPGPQTYKSFGALARLLPGASVRLTDRWTVGGTIGLAISHVELEGPYFLNSAPLTGTPTNLDLQATGTAFTWSLGTQYQLTDKTTIGINYQSENRFESEGQAGVLAGPLGFSYYDIKLGMTWARSVGIGIQHKLDSRQRFGVDLEWEDWSSAFDNLNLTFTNPTSIVHRTVVGPTIHEVFPLQWKDAIIVSTGYELDVNDSQTFRCGYRYQDNPVPASATTTYLQTTLKHHFSIGYGLEHRGWELDGAYQFAFAPEVSTGQSVYAGGDFSNAKITTQTHMIFVGAQRRF